MIFDTSVTDQEHDDDSTTYRASDYNDPRQLHAFLIIVLIFV
jgi:hypothetical protein